MPTKQKYYLSLGDYGEEVDLPSDPLEAADLVLDLVDRWGACLGYPSIMPLEEIEGELDETATHPAEKPNLAKTIHDYLDSNLTDQAIAEMEGDDLRLLQSTLTALEERIRSETLMRFARVFRQKDDQA